MNKKIMAVAGVGLTLMLGTNVFADEFGSDADMEKYQMDDVYTAVSGTAFYHKADGTTETKSVYVEEEPGYEDDFWIEHNIEDCKKELNTWLEQYEVAKSETAEDLVLDYTYTYEINLGDYGFGPMPLWEDDGIDDSYTMPTGYIVEVTEVHQVYTIEINAYEVDPDEQKEPENNEEINDNEGENNKPELDDNDNRNPQVDKDEDTDNNNVEDVDKVEEKDQEETSTPTEQNPNTSDPILYSLGLFGISSLGIIKKIRK